MPFLRSDLYGRLAGFPRQAAVSKFQFVVPPTDTELLVPGAVTLMLTVALFAPVGKAELKVTVN